MTSVLALALGIGANVAIFSLVDALVIRPLPLSHPEQLVDVFEDQSYLGFPRDTPALANFADWQKRNRVFSGMGALRGQIFAITGDGQPEQVEGNAITANLFPLLGAAPILGRNILPEEDRPGNERVVLISHRLWQQRYGADRALIGRDILLDGVRASGDRRDAARFHHARAQRRVGAHGILTAATANPRQPLPRGLGAPETRRHRRRLRSATCPTSPPNWPRNTPIRIVTWAPS